MSLLVVIENINSESALLGVCFFRQHLHEVEET